MMETLKNVLIFFSGIYGLQNEACFPYTLLFTPFLLKPVVEVKTLRLPHVSRLVERLSKRMLPILIFCSSKCCPLCRQNLLK